MGVRGMGITSLVYKSYNRTRKTLLSEFRSLSRYFCVYV